MDVQTLLLVTMIFIIWYAHYDWMCNQDRKLIKFFILISFFLFAIIFVDHVVETSKHTTARDQKELTDKDLQRLRTNNIFNQNNIAIKLCRKLITHPIFYMY